MPHLKTLKFASAKPVAHSDPIWRACDRVVEALAEQKAMAEANLADQQYDPTRKV